MKAVVLKQHGAIDSLEYVTDFPDPRRSTGHVVIRVGATSFNYHDIFTVRGMPGIKVPMPMIIGLDIGGRNPRSRAPASAAGKRATACW